MIVTWATEILNTMKIIDINENVNVRLFKILNLDSTLRSNTRLFLYTYYSDVTSVMAKNMLNINREHSSQSIEYGHHRNRFAAVSLRYEPQQRPVTCAVFMLITKHASVLLIGITILQKTKL